MITKTQLLKNSVLSEKILEKVKTEYLESFMSIDQFSDKYQVSTTALRALFKKNGIKKDRSKWNSSKVPENIAKIKRTKLERYGSENYNNVEKNKQTCLERYGVESVHQLESMTKIKKETFNSHYAKGSSEYEKLIQNRTSKRNQTLKEMDYGEAVRNTRKQHAEEDPNFLESIQSKRKETCLKRYGVSNVSSSEEIIQKKKNTYNSRIEAFEKANNCTQYIKLIEKYGQGWLSIFDQLKTLYNCNNLFILNSDIHLIEDYKGASHTFKSLGEKEVVDYVKSIYNGTVLENDRQVINPKELDIYIPDRKVAIEYNGMYWHAFDNNRHLEKTELCNNKGIRLLHIFDDQWILKKNICKSLISSSLGIYNKKIYARKCKCKEIDSKTYRDFLNENHIQGEVNSSIRLGLFYNGELVQVAGWGKSRFKKGEMELHRMCSKNFTQVIGGFSKLIKHSKIDSFISYIDRSLFNGNGYKECGFTFDSFTPPSYFYCKQNQPRISRLAAQKHKLKDLENYDESKTEKEIMVENGFLQIYDCGNVKVCYTNNRCLND